MVRWSGGQVVSSYADVCTPPARHPEINSSVRRWRFQRRATLFTTTKEGSIRNVMMMVIIIDKLRIMVIMIDKLRMILMSIIRVVRRAERQTTL